MLKMECTGLTRKKLPQICLYINLKGRAKFIYWATLFITLLMLFTFIWLIVLTIHVQNRNSYLLIVRNILSYDNQENILNIITNCALYHLRMPCIINLQGCLYLLYYSVVLKGTFMWSQALLYHTLVRVIRALVSWFHMRI